MRKILTLVFILISLAGFSGEPEPQKGGKDAKIMENERPAGDKLSFDEQLVLAEQGIASSQFIIGRMCEKGEGIKQDSVAAAKWYQKAAEQGFVKGQYNIGVMYYQGEGVQKDYKEAMKWFLKAAEQGFVKAQHNIGVMFQMGEGVTKDFTQAYSWFTIAASSDDKHSAMFRDLIEKEMVPAKIEEGKKLSTEWLENHPQKK